MPGVGRSPLSRSWERGARGVRANRVGLPRELNGLGSDSPWYFVALQLFVCVRSPGAVDGPPRLSPSESRAAKEAAEEAV